MAGSQRAKVLLLMDQPLANLVAFTLRHTDYDVQSAATLKDAIRVLDTWRPDLVIADYDRHADALDLTDKGQRVRSVPVVAMTRRRDTPVKLTAFDRGAHDLIEVPFTPDEIVARAVAALRRTRGIRTTIVPKIRIGGDVEIDVMKETVGVDGDLFRLTPLQHTLLYLLAANAGTILTRDQIIQDLWGSTEMVESNVVDRHVRDLRVKLRDNWKEPRYIETIPGKGYRFVAQALQERAMEASAGA
jgi:two-component system KDP operon response regulator KdpE